ncbi:hypothetical protein HanIR_Chr04g0154041 [Helianthus annuus]|nr:hypothetical protein HanIR_Chr04g0154041 [Helianthus annuus]
MAKSPLYINYSHSLSRGRLLRRRCCSKTSRLHTRRFCHTLPSPIHNIRPRCFHDQPKWARYCQHREGLTAHEVRL